MSLQMQHPFTAIVSGPTSSGKSHFTFRLISHANEIISPPPEEIVWCYGIYQNEFANVSNVRFVEGVPDMKDFDGSKRTLIVIDDLMHEANGRVAEILHAVVTIEIYLYYFSRKTYFIARNTIVR